MCHNDNDTLSAGHEVHCATHALDHLARDHPVGEVTILADLHRAQDCEVDMSASNHSKGIRTREEG